ncbi:MAG: hypothetical protein IPO06_14080 [Leptospiraceae bacterium]|nr:hypothetical protein [Leptospiraceae bacterium]
MNLPENLPADIKQYILDLAYKHNALEETNANLVKENTSLTQDKQSLAKENEIKQNKILKLESIILILIERYLVINRKRLIHMICIMEFF